MKREKKLFLGNEKEGNETMIDKKKCWKRW